MSDIRAHDISLASPAVAAAAPVALFPVAGVLSSAAAGSAFQAVESQHEGHGTKQQGFQKLRVSV